VRGCKNASKSLGYVKFTLSMAPTIVGFFCSVPFHRSLQSPIYQISSFFLPIHITREPPGKLKAATTPIQPHQPAYNTENMLFVALIVIVTFSILFRQALLSYFVLPLSAPSSRRGTFLGRLRKSGQLLRWVSSYAACVHLEAAGLQ